jgi:hypothetical protein
MSKMHDLFPMPTGNAINPYCPQIRRVENLLFSGGENAMELAQIPLSEMSKAAPVGFSAYDTLLKLSADYLRIAAALREWEDAQAKKGGVA